MVIEKITAMQAGLEGTPEWMVGEQLKEICADLDCAGLVEQDLAGDGMGLKECAAKIKAYADEQRKPPKQTVSASRPTWRRALSASSTACRSGPLRRSRQNRPNRRTAS